jgi:hypothetical protein
VPAAKLIGLVAELVAALGEIRQGLRAVEPAVAVAVIVEA